MLCQIQRNETSSVCQVSLRLCLAIRLDFVSSSTAHLGLVILMSLEPLTKGTPNVLLTRESPQQPVQLGSVMGAVSLLLGWVIQTDGHVLP